MLVDDQSRIARELGASINLIFNELPALGVKLIDCSTGRASDERGARALFGVNAIVTDQFLEMVRHETHRGMEGRALAGFHTGGRVFGYSTKPEDNPPDHEHPRAVIYVNDDEAAIVRRIFELWVEGHALKAIATQLNDEGIPAPHDGGRGNKVGRGWPHSTVRALLRNQRYIGRVVWNQCQWVKKPDGKRRRVERPESEWKTADRAELRIIDDETWQAAQARFRQHPQRRRARPHGSGRYVSPLSGLLKCGVCGGSICAVARKVKNGVRYVSLGCNSYQMRGASICANSKTISEKKMLAGVVAELQALLDHPAAVTAFVEGFKERVREREAAEDDGTDLKRQIATAQRSVSNLLDAFSRVGFSEALAGKLKEAETRLAALKAKQSQATHQGRGKVLPHPRAIQGFLANLLRLLEADPVRARQELLRFMPPLVLTPTPDGYKAVGAFNMSVALKHKTPEGLASGVSGLISSGGRHCRTLKLSVEVRLMPLS